MKKTLLATLLAVACLQARGQLIINELMQSNIDCLMDDLNEFPDSWVELYNSGEEAVNLNQYKLGDEEDATKAYQLPYKLLQPQQYIVIYCDKEAKGLHTDFRLESGKNAAAYLFQGETCIDKVEKLNKQPAPNIAYGRKTEGEDKWMELGNGVKVEGNKKEKHVVFDENAVGRYTLYFNDQSEEFQWVYKTHKGANKFFLVSIYCHIN